MWCVMQGNIFLLTKGCFGVKSAGVEKNRGFIMKKNKNPYVLLDVPMVWADIYGMPAAVRMAYLRDAKKTK